MGVYVGVANTVDAHRDRSICNDGKKATEVFFNLLLHLTDMEVGAYLIIE